jgi:hypothetical protein
LLFRRGRTVSATVAAAAALLSVKQLILALPLAAWLVAPPDRRTRSAGPAPSREWRSSPFSCGPGRIRGSRPRSANASSACWTIPVLRPVPRPRPGSVLDPARDRLGASGHPRRAPRGWRRRRVARPTGRRRRPADLGAAVSCRRGRGPRRPGQRPGRPLRPSTGLAAPVHANSAVNWRRLLG